MDFIKITTTKRWKQVHRYIRHGLAMDHRTGNEPSLLPQGSRDFTSGAGAAARRKIPEAIKRAVFRRSEGRCQHLLPDGSRCGATRMVEIDHIEPIARSGGDEAANLTLVCREHNQYRARLMMGDRTMDRFRSESRSSHRSRRMVGP